MIRDQDVSIHRRKFKSRFNAPNVGEFNNAKVTPYIEPDPSVETRFKNGVIYLYAESRIKRGNNRRANYMSTKYDCRNDPAWHSKNRQTFVIGPIVTNGDEKREVATLDELGLVDSEGNPVTQEFLDTHMGYLNGETTIGQFTSSTTMHRVTSGQKTITKTKKRYAENSAELPVSENELRYRRRVMDSFDKQFLQMVMMANEFAKLDVLVLFIASGSGIFNCDTRRLTGLYSKIPSDLLDPKNKFFEPFQKHYNFLRFRSKDVTVSFLPRLYLMKIHIK